MTKDTKIKLSETTVYYGITTCSELKYHGYDIDAASIIFDEARGQVVCDLLKSGQKVGILKYDHINRKLSAHELLSAPIGSILLTETVHTSKENLASTNSNEAALKASAISELIGALENNVKPKTSSIDQTSVNKANTLKDLRCSGYDMDADLLTYLKEEDTNSITITKDGQHVGELYFYNRGRALTLEEIESTPFDEMFLFDELDTESIDKTLVQTYDALNQKSSCFVLEGITVYYGITTPRDLIEHGYKLFYELGKYREKEDINSIAFMKNGVSIGELFFYGRGGEMSVEDIENTPIDEMYIHSEPDKPAVTIKQIASIILIIITLIRIILSCEANF